MPFLLLFFVAPILVISIHLSYEESITDLDRLNRTFGVIVFIVWLFVGEDPPPEAAVIASLSMIAFLCAIWFVFWLLPWLQLSLLVLITLAALIGLFGTGSYVGQFLIFLVATIWALITTFLTLASDSVKARYWRMNWTNPSPLEEKTGVAMSPYSRPRTINDSFRRPSFWKTYRSKSKRTLPLPPPNPLPEIPSMDQYKLEKRLQSIGKQVFVEQYSLFENYAHKLTSKEDAVEQLVSCGVSNENGAVIRLSNAKTIFDEKMERAALVLIAQSKRIDASTLRKANILLGNNQ